MSNDNSKPLSGLINPLNGEISEGSRPLRTTRYRNIRVAKSLPVKGKRVLDIGCAEGLHSLYIADEAKEVIGIDHRKSVIDIADKNKEFINKDNVTFICGDLRDEGVINKLGSFDLILAWGLLHRISDIFRFLQFIAPITNQLSLEWRTPILPMMAGLNLAYHSNSDDIDTTNLEDEDESHKIEGTTGFWEPTPASVIRICRRSGFLHHKILGYNESFMSGTTMTIRGWSSFFYRKIRKNENEQLPRGRVHLLMDKTDNLHDFRLKKLQIPEWDHYMINRKDAK